MQQEKEKRHFVVRKPEGKRPLGRQRRRWEDNIKMVLQKVRRALWGMDGVGSE
jgi:hypothetical protein